MTINLFSRVIPVIALFSAATMMAQNFQTMPVSSGYTSDVIANGVGSAMISTTTDVDGVSYAFVSRDYQLTASSTPLTYGLPINGTINSVVASTPGLQFQLGDYFGNNSLRINTVTGTDTGTMVFSTPVPAFKLYMLSTSGSGSSTVNVTVNFTDNTSQVFTGQSISDWYGGSNFAIQGIGRILRTTDALGPNSTDPRLYQTALNIDPANQTKPIQSVTITKTNSSGVMNVFAFSADVYSDCAAPTLNAATAVTSNSAQISWTVPTGNQAVSHDIYYSTSATPPTSATAPNYSNVVGTSYTLGNLSPSTNYYYWVRTNCSGTTSKSVWSFSKSLTTLCGAVVPAYTNNFTSYPGNCWSNNLSGGDPDTGPTGNSVYWSQRNFLNGPSNGSAYMNLFGTSKTGWLKTMLFDLSAGGYKVKFDYGVTAYFGTASSAMDSDDVVHFLVSNDGGTTWMILQTWNANNSPSNTSNEYTFDLANFMSANTVFAFYGSTGSVDDDLDYNFYVDNFTVEKDQLSTSEVNRQTKKASVHPNPFKDILYFSDTREVKTATVTDVSGRIVKTADGSIKELDLSRLNSGLYFVTLYFKDGSKSTVKAIKK
ncbi:T9SS C-terminal target domain-containing protein [Chryseobacterium sp. G0186]|uniref:T9SS type A sorting domain-containing protein n=1 Tax=Chryseobacterium sp. G0186 TaxID=2487064 RepID=UPI000F4EF40B|nr:T9SS type A sorting domain-containing protein [Chryseobacterium sp. G0186]AZA77838.1 T9SS C-terminal target domain-containing protein [Chryseobacterium sp. G0186]